MVNQEQTSKLHYILRISSAMCFIGHGTFGIITKDIWTNYFAVFGIDHGLAYSLMPVVGIVDILFGIILLIYPVRAGLLWLVCWGMITASLRPLSGEPLAELIERAGNYGAPLTLLLLSGFPSGFKGWFTHIGPDTQNNIITTERLTLFLRLIVFLLLLGHGLLNLIQKKGLLNQYTLLGFTNPVQMAKIIGIAEVIAALLILIKPLRPFVLILFIWKMSSELFYPHYEMFEWIERGGSYGCLLALWTLLSNKKLVFSSDRISPTEMYSAIKTHV